MIRSHPAQPAHGDAISRCIDACYTCVEACSACADACLSDSHVERLAASIRLNLDCASVCGTTGEILARASRAGTRQLLEAQLTTCIAFCRACATACGRHAETHKHCRMCAESCLACAEACDQMLATLRMPA
jgi:hypothetical protein